ncbi:MAG: complex I NDUFA9 subunit family protein [Rhodanobacteraceae bacterium]|nr:complex I NDUFA9 subunit family protein [Pseudomonadota bacterium]
MKSQRIVILGGTGFIGSHLAPRLAADGHRLTLLSRNREQHRALTVLPSLRVVSVDVYDRAALARRLVGHDAVINLVGILNETGGARFARAHVDLTATAIAACREAGIGRLLQMSSLNAGSNVSKYLKTRGEAETLVKNSGLDWTIFRPSIVYGRGDGLVTRFHRLLQISPMLPLARPKAKIAPVYVGDVCEALARCIERRDSGGKIHELYGPDVYTLIAIVRMTRDVTRLHRIVMPLPDALGWLQARVCDFIPGKPFSSDNFKSLKLDSVGNRDGLAELNIAPRHFAAVLPELLDLPAHEQRMDAARASQRDSSRHGYEQATVVSGPAK